MMMMQIPATMRFNDNERLSFHDDDMRRLQIDGDEPVTLTIVIDDEIADGRASKYLVTPRWGAPFSDGMLRES
ncbi:hypothetical protein F0562_013715 [Nyssa sinensis]|uniref:Uncharacterized protein n=1 Tax=Nyssa sinensis TaxID=561372 RepID=A0A5J4ZNB4_9ASTE|nr:hypothetical protein F0562_013715 [Nyssa sinensis]